MTGDGHRLPPDLPVRSHGRSTGSRWCRTRLPRSNASGTRRRHPARRRSASACGMVGPLRQGAPSVCLCTGPWPAASRRRVGGRRFLDLCGVKPFGVTLVRSTPSDPIKDRRCTGGLIQAIGFPARSAHLRTSFNVRYQAEAVLLRSDRPKQARRGLRQGAGCPSQRGTARRLSPIAGYSETPPSIGYLRRR